MVSRWLERMGHSRDTPYFGFLIPNEQDKYFYVWLDAPIGYMASFKNYCDKNRGVSFDDYWREKVTLNSIISLVKILCIFMRSFGQAVLHGAKFRTPSAILLMVF